jgi:dimethylglycine dehydrogenase
LGARIIRRCRATDIKQLPTGEWKVSTEKGDIVCEHVVNAGGTYARQMGEWSGLLVPMTSMTHHYLVTDTVPEFRDLERELPVIRDDKKVSGYIRMEQKSGLIGIYEKANPNAVWLDHCPGKPRTSCSSRLRPDHALARERHGADADLRRTRASSARCTARFPIRRTAIR